MPQARKRRTAGAGESGVALVLVLWILVILSMLTMGFATSSRTEMLVAGNGIDQVRVRGLLSAGVERAVYALQPAEGDPRRWRTDGTPYDFTLESGLVSVRVGDTAGRLDVNRADAEQIASLLRTVGVAAAQADRLADAVVDWRDTDSERSPRGAEASDYAAAGLAPPGDRPFRTVEELRDVRGMDGAIVAVLLPHVTVLSPAAGINPLSADPTVLFSLPGVTEGQVASVIRQRAASTAPDPQRIADLLPSASEQLHLTAGPVYVVTVEATTPRGGRGRLEAVVWIGADRAPYRILDWRENAPMAETATTGP
jgi:general secretion pathway protein K